MSTETDTIPKTRRRPVTLTIREDIMTEAKAFSLNASQAAEAGIVQALRKAKEEAWLADNAEAIAAHNARVEKHGTLLRAPWAR